MRRRASRQKARYSLSPVLRFELLEDRRMLSMADVVFLVDNSESDSHVTKDWLLSIIDEFDSSLRNTNVDVRYGVVAFGETYEMDGLNRFAHSLVLNPNATTSADRLFSSGNPEEHVTALEDAFAHLIEEERGGEEDGQEKGTFYFFRGLRAGSETKRDTDSSAFPANSATVSFHFR